MFLFDRSPSGLLESDKTLAGRSQRPFSLSGTHTVLGTPIDGPVPAGFEVTVFGLGCFWGAEEAFWQVPGVYTTAVGYAGGVTPNPTYDEVCSGRTNHTEAVRVVYDPSVVSFEQLLKTFWEVHDPTQGMRQGNDRGSQYRSAVYTTTDAQREQALATREVYGKVLKSSGYGDISTEILPAGEFYFAEDYHQQYLDKNPNGYRCHAATGISYPA